MQLLTFTVAGHDYAIESRNVVEVLPLVPGRPIPHTPDYVLGMFTYRGSLVPLVDLGLRLVGHRSGARLSTRLVVVEFPRPEAEGATPSAFVRLALVAEEVVAIRSADPATAELPPLDLPDAPFLGRIFRLGDRTVQLVRVEHLLPADLAAGLYPAGGGPPR
jgi:chemotaxis-related protein WspB